MSESLNWFKRNEAEVKETIEQIKAMQSPVAIQENGLVTFEVGEQSIPLEHWDAAVALCLVLGIPVEYM